MKKRYRDCNIANSKENVEKDNQNNQRINNQQKGY